MMRMLRGFMPALLLLSFLFLIPVIIAQQPAFVPIPLQNATPKIIQAVPVEKLLAF